MGARRAAVITLAAILAVGVTVVSSGTPALYVWWVVAPGLAVAAVVTGVRRHRPVNRTPWWVLATSLVLLWIGWSASAAVASGIAGPLVGPLGTFREVVYLVAYPTLVVASLLMVHARTGGRDRDSVIDALIVMVSLATSLGAWLFGDAEVADVVTDLDLAWISVSPLLVAAVVAAAVRIVFSAGHRIPAAWGLVAASVLALVGNLSVSQLVRDGRPTQVTAIDAVWVVAFVAVASAALHPSMRQLTEPASTDDLVRGIPVDRLVLVGGAIVVAPLSHLRIGSAGGETVPIVVGGVVVALLAVWRVARLLRQRETARDDLAHAARRDATVAMVSRWALDERSSPALLADVDELLRTQLSELVRAVVPVAATGASDGDRVAGAGEVGLRIPVEDGGTHVADLVTRVDPARTGRVGDLDALVAIAAVLSAGIRRRSAEAQLRHDLLHDPLTGLPNRTLAVDRVGQLLRARDGDEVAVVFVDLDGFKAVNDTFGHGAGDGLLRDVAERLRGAVRDGDTVARISGDEFVVALARTDRSTLDALVARLLDATAVRFEDGMAAISVTASIGVAITRDGADDAESLLRRADGAMYAAKRRGGAAAAWSPDPGAGVHPDEPQPAAAPHV